jgi:hypothetical protein
MAHSSHSASHNAAPPTGTVEPDYVDIGAIYKFGIGLAVITIVSHILMYWMWISLTASVDASNPPRVYPLDAETQETRRPPEPRLQEGVSADNGGRLLPHEEVPGRSLGVREALKNLHDEEDQILSSYHWVDRNNQIVRIPVADAMKLTLQRGLASRAQTPAAAAPVAAPITREGK